MSARQLSHTVRCAVIASSHFLATVTRIHVEPRAVQIVMLSGEHHRDEPQLLILGLPRRAPLFYHVLLPYPTSHNFLLGSVSLSARMLILL